MEQNQFLLSSDECELLLYLELNLSLQELSQKIGRDASGISRSLARIAEKYPALEKKSGKWILSDVGLRLNSLTRDAIQGQRALAEKRGSLRIGTNREFGARVLSSSMTELTEIFPNTHFFVNTYEHGTERALLDGQIDVGIDCDRPNDPDIGFKLILSEPIVAVASPKFMKKYKIDSEKQNFSQLPHLQCGRLHPDKIFVSAESAGQAVCTFNDIATARATCVNGIGWALLPEYAVQDELQSKKLVLLTEKRFGTAKYGIWWHRKRIVNKQWIESLCEWLKTKKLD